MYVYIRSEAGFTVGFYRDNGESMVWVPQSDHDNRDSAAQRVHYLNGGRGRVATGDEWRQAQEIPLNC